MAALRYRDEHNKVGYLQKPTGSDDYHQILDFLRASHIRYALTNDPIIFDSLVKQFWSTATLRSPELGPPAILATIDETPYTITEDSVRSQLQLADDGGIDDLPIAEIYSGMDNLGYVTEGKLTFYKNKFSPQWRFLVHTILHCLSTKSGSWDQFGSSLAVALICLSDGRKFNWSSYIFKGMVSNIGNAKKFLMYPRFLQTILGIETSFTRQYHVFKLSSKLFANMKLNFEGQPMQLLAAMLPQDQEGEGAGVAAQAVPPPIPEPIPEPMPEPDQPQDHLSTPPRQQTSDPIAPVFEHGQSSDPNIASFSRVHETEDEPLGGSFHASPPRSTQAPPAGHTSGGAEDLITLTAVSSVVSTLVQKVNSLETSSMDTKKAVKRSGGKLDNKVKAIEVKLNTKRKVRRFYDFDSNIPPVVLLSSHIPTDIPPVVLLSSSQYSTKDSYYTVWVMNVTEDNFPFMMAFDFIKRKKQQKLLPKKMAKGKDVNANDSVQQRTYMVRIDQVFPPKQQKFTEAPIPSVPDVPQPPVELDLDADDKTFIKVVSDEDYTDECSNTWTLAGWEVRHIKSDYGCEMLPKTLGKSNSPNDSGLSNLPHVLRIVPKSVAGSRFPEGSSTLLTFDVQVNKSTKD
ncbi:hypothetical protein Tco_0529847 [Tanacetum coccineum]